MKGLEFREGHRRDKRQVSKDVVERYGHMSQVDACKELKMSTRTLRKRCRELGVKRWPYKPARGKKAAMARAEGTNTGSAFTAVSREAPRVVEGKSPGEPIDKVSAWQAQVAAKAAASAGKTANHESGFPLKYHERLQILVLLNEARNFFEAECSEREKERLAEVQNKTNDELHMFCVQLKEIMFAPDALRHIKSIDLHTTLMIIEEVQSRLLKLSPSSSSVSK